MTNTVSTHPKFEKAKQMFEDGHIPDFQTIFSIAPHSNVAKITNIHNLRLKAKIKDPGQFKLSELISIAAVLDIDADALCKLALDTIKAQESEPKD